MAGRWRPPTSPGPIPSIRAARMCARASAAARRRCRQAFEPRFGDDGRSPGRAGVGSATVLDGTGRPGTGQDRTGPSTGVGRADFVERDRRTAARPRGASHHRGPLPDRLGRARARGHGPCTPAPLRPPGIDATCANRRGLPERPCRRWQCSAGRTARRTAWIRRTGRAGRAGCAAERSRARRGVRRRHPDARASAPSAAVPDSAARAPGQSRR